MSALLTEYLTYYLVFAFIVTGVCFFGGKNKGLYMARIMFVRIPWQLVLAVWFVISSVFGLVFAGFRRR